MKSFTCVRLCATPWTVPCQAPPSMRFSRQEYWSGLPLSFPGDLPNPEIKPRSPTLQADYALSLRGSLASTNSKLPIHPFPNPSPRPGNHESILYVCEFVFIS